VEALPSAAAAGGESGLALCASAADVLRSTAADSKDITPLFM